MEPYYRNAVPYERRQLEASRILEKYPGRYPFIVERAHAAKANIPHIQKKKYLVPGEITMGQFIAIIRRNIAITPDIAIYIFCNNVLLPSNMLIKDVYNLNKEPDGFVYMNYMGESTFGRML
jgi:GABA(A) receptor-associated protein